MKVGFFSAVFSKIRRTLFEGTAVSACIGYISLVAIPIFIILSVLYFFGLGGYFLWPGGPKQSASSIPKDTPAVVKENIENLYSPQINKRIASIKKLRSLGDKAKPAIPFLISILGDDTTIITKEFTYESPSFEATLFLVEFEPDSIELVINQLYNKDKNIRKGVVQTIGRFKNLTSKIELLNITINDSAWEVRDETAKTFKLIRTCQTIKPLLSLLEDKNATVRESAVRSLCSVGAYQVINPIISMALNDQSQSVRVTATNCFQLLGNMMRKDDQRLFDIYDALDILVKDEKKRVRETATWLSGQMHPRNGYSNIINCDIGESK